MFNYVLTYVHFIARRDSFVGLNLDLYIIRGHNQDWVSTRYSIYLYWFLGSDIDQTWRIYKISKRIFRHMMTFHSASSMRRQATWNWILDMDRIALPAISNTNITIFQSQISRFIMIQYDRFLFAWKISILSADDFEIQYNFNSATIL